MSTQQWFAEFERQENMREERIDKIRAAMQRRDAIGRFVRLCTDCYRNPADLPGKLCPVCEGYRQHTGEI